MVLATAGRRCIKFKRIPIDVKHVYLFGERTCDTTRVITRRAAASPRGCDYVTIISESTKRVGGLPRHTNTDFY